MEQIQRSNGKSRKFFPYLIVLAALVSIGIIIYTSAQRIVSIAEQMAFEDAEIIHWWYQNELDTLNAQTASLAFRVSDAANFEDLVETMGLANHAGYLAWLGPDQSVIAELNPETLIGDPLSRKMFAFVPAVKQPAADLWSDDGLPYFISMAPVPQDQGGGVILLQLPLEDERLARLAQLTGRDVVFYTFEEQNVLASSNPALIADPPLLDVRWMKEVATGQVPRSIQTRNSQGEQIVGITAFQDFGRISYSGYLAMVEPVTHVTGRIPQTMFIILAVIALVILLVGCVLLYRQAHNYLEVFREYSVKQRRTTKWRMVGLTALFLVPLTLVAGYIVIRTGNESKEIDRRSTEITTAVTFDAFDSLVERVNLFMEAPQLQAETAEALADKARLAHGFDFAMVAPSGELSYLGDDAFPEDLVEKLMNLEPGQVMGFASSGLATVLAGKQTLPDGTSIVAGYRLDRRVKNISANAPLSLTIFEGAQPVATSHTERELETLTFSPELDQQLDQAGEMTYEQKVHWHNSKLAAAVLNIANPEQWRFIASQASITWTNATKSYQALTGAILITLFLIVGVILTVVLNQDHPLRLRTTITGYLFILPAFIWLIWWQLGPALFTVFLSFHKWSVLDPAKPFVGLHNFRLILDDDKFWNAMWNTLVFTIQIPISMALSLALALALNRQLKGIRALRTIYYMPAVTSIVVVSLMWQLLYNQDLGVFNYLLDFIGLGPYGWLQSTTMALPSIMGMSIWLALGAQMLLFLAGLQGIPDEFYEAAEVDGANPWYKFWHITLPLLAPTTFFVLVTSIIASFQVFGPIYVLTDGGPSGATDVVVYRIYFEAWQNLRFGYASAETVVLFAVLFIVTLFQFRYFGKRVSYG